MDIEAPSCATSGRCGTQVCLAVNLGEGSNREDVNRSSPLFMRSPERINGEVYKGWPSLFRFREAAWPSVGLKTVYIVGSIEKFLPTVSPPNPDFTTTISIHHQTLLPTSKH
jgi:hypothetical protein